MALLILALCPPLSCGTSVLIAALTCSGGSACQMHRREVSVKALCQRARARAAGADFHPGTALQQALRLGESRTAYLQGAHPGPLTRCECRHILREPDGSQEVRRVVAHQPTRVQNLLLVRAKAASNARRMVSHLASCIRILITGLSFKAG
jgi:hypothetical protein